MGAQAGTWESASLFYRRYWAAKTAAIYLPYFKNLFLNRDQVYV